MKGIFKPKYLMHITTKSKVELENYLIPHKNATMYKDNFGNYIFATSRKTALKAYYFLKRPCMYMFSYTLNNVCVLIKTYEEYQKVIEGTSYVYKIPSETFEPVIHPDTTFGGEWISKEKINVSNCKCNKITFDDIIKKNKFGNAVNLYVCKNIYIYNNIRAKLNEIPNYFDKYIYLKKKNGIYETIHSKIKIFTEE